MKRTCKFHRRWLRALTVFAVCTAMIACGKTIRWKQEVLLHDGRVIVVDRVSKQIGRIFPENVIIEYEQTISFSHPDTSDRFSWELPEGTLAKLLDFEKGVPYFVLRPASVADYNEWGCPNPPFLVFRYEKNNWLPVNISKLPARFSLPNLLDSAHSSDKLTADSLVTVEEMHSYLKASMIAASKIISREKINPIGEGCFESILLKPGRQSEIDRRR